MSKECDHIVGTWFRPYSHGGLGLVRESDFLKLIGDFDKPFRYCPNCGEKNKSLEEKIRS